MSGPISQAVDEIKRLGGTDKVDVERIAKRYGVEARQLRQRLARSATFARALETNRRQEDSQNQTSSSQTVPRRGSGEKHRVQLRFWVNGILVKLYRQEFYRGDIKIHTRRGSEQCLCGRDLIEHAVPVVSDARRPTLLCECGATYEAEVSQ